MGDERALRSELERVQKALQLERTMNAELRDRVSQLLAEVERLTARTAEITADRERLAKELLAQALNPHQQGSAFSTREVEALVAFLKNQR